MCSNRVRGGSDDGENREANCENGRDNPSLQQVPTALIEEPGGAKKDFEEEVKARQQGGKELEKSIREKEERANAQEEMISRLLFSLVISTQTLLIAPYNESIRERFTTIAYTEKRQYYASYARENPRCKG